MQKTLLSLSVFALGVLSASAQQARLEMFQNLNAINADGGMETVGGSITAVSPNGKYAVGSDWDRTYSSWIWQADGEVIQTSDLFSDNVVLDVANDGTAVGSYYDHIDNLVYPAYRTIDGVWHKLPIPSYAQNDNRVSSKSQYNDARLPYAPTAYYISGDGKHIGGWTYAAVTADRLHGFDAKLHGFFWHLDEGTGSYVLEEFADMDYTTRQQGLATYAMNEEGTVLAGLAPREDNGIFEPTAIINGELVTIISATAGDFSEAFEKGSFEGSCFSAAGKYIFGYGVFTKVNVGEDGEIESEDKQPYSFRYDIETRAIDRLYGSLLAKVGRADGSCLCVNADKHGELVLVDADFRTTHPFRCPGEVSDVFSASDNLDVIGGVNQYLTAFGPVNTPVLVTYGGTLPEGLGAQTVQKPSVMYDLQGRRLNEAPTTGIYLRDGKKIMAR